MYTSIEQVETAAEKAAWAEKERNCSEVVTYLTKLENARVVHSQMKESAEKITKGALP